MSSEKRTRRTDCIYCGADTGSREHTFPAALGGRRMNKGILCEPCNSKFSPLDNLLSRQLSFINGVIGVRPDRAAEPRPARVESVEGPLMLDHEGKPSFAAPRMLTEEPLPDGRRRVSMEFANERQAQEWIAQQRAAGLEVKQERRSEARQRFLADRWTRISDHFGTTGTAAGPCCTASRWRDLSNSCKSSRGCCRVACTASR